MANMDTMPIDQLILDYFVQEGYEEAALSFAKETRTRLSPETVSPSKLVRGFSTIQKRKEIKGLILRGDIEEAIQKTNEYFPTILDQNNLLHFYLLRLNLTELIRNHKFNTNLNDMEEEKEFLNRVLTFVREHLISKVADSFKLLKELEITMSLLCLDFNKPQQLPDELQSLFNLQLRNQCYRLVNKEILNFEPSNDLVMKGEVLPLVSVDVEFQDDDDELFDDLLTTSKVSAVEKLAPTEKLLEPDIKVPLDSKLESVLKLWILTELRLIEMNVKDKRELLLDVL